MKAEPVSLDKFLQIYGNVLVHTWADPEMKKRFKEHPEEVLKEFGLDPGGAKVRVLNPRLNPDNPQATRESQYDLWNQGLTTGEIQFIYPEEAPEGIPMELSEDQLEAIAGGGDACCCCSCCPCCSCC